MERMTHGDVGADCWLLLLLNDYRRNAKRALEAVIRGDRASKRKAAGSTCRSAAVQVDCLIEMVGLRSLYDTTTSGLQFSEGGVCLFMRSGHFLTFVPVANSDYHPLKCLAMPRPQTETFSDAPGPAGALFTRSRHKNAPTPFFFLSKATRPDGVPVFNSTHTGISIHTGHLLIEIDGLFEQRRDGFTAASHCPSWPWSPAACCRRRACSASSPA